MKIDQLPVEMLMKIFSYVPTHDEVSLTNKLFYNIVCKVFDSNICVRLNDRMNSHCLQSINKSKRKISRVELDQRFINLRADQGVSSIIKNFSTSITFLKYIDADINETTFLEMLSLIPNIQQLDLSLRHESHSTHELQCTNYLNLKELKSLVVNGCEFFRVFNYLPVGVLTELQVTCYYWDYLILVINRQLNIKKLKLRDLHYNTNDDKLATDIFDKLQLVSLDLEGKTMISVTIAEILSKQSKLKSLILSHKPNGTRVDDRVMTAVAGLSELETLAMDISDTPAASFVKIRKLKLKDLTLRCGEMSDHCRSKMKILAASDNTSIIALAISGEFKMSADLFIALAESAPNLKHLILLPGYIMQIDELDAILTCFRSVEVLEIRIWCAPLLDRLLSDYFNPKLRELTFTGRNYKPWLTRFIVAYPNLKKFKLDLMQGVAHISMKIRPILSRFKKLESLSLRVWHLTVDDLHCLCDHKDNLKFVSLGYLNEAMLTDEIIGKLRENFAVTIVDVLNHISHFGPVHGRTLNLAVDRETMNCKREIGV